MLIDQIDVTSEFADGDESAGPLSVPAIGAVARDGLRFTSELVVLVGANGSGKSTLLEGIAQAYGIDVRGGHAGRRYASTVRRSPLGDALRLRHVGLRVGSAGRRATGFFLRAETAFGVMAHMTEMGIAGYGDRRSDEVSHGESYPQAITGQTFLRHPRRMFSTD
jgi:predicted ATPase